ncbi:THAP domain-containing protein 4-like isoform X2 [Acanthaster planci]|nr:THAP domain-containing protein 4-like isoform X2 [Acanthaster planci]
MAKLHEGAQPLAWLLGQWESIEAKGMFPTSSSFNYTETLNITHLGQPVLNFYSETWMEGVPKHIESGFLRMNPGTTRVAYMCAQNAGIVEIEEGELDGTSVELTEPSLLRMTFAKEEGATGLKRTFRLKSDGHLEQIVFMTTPKTPFSKHLHVTYKKKDT